MTGRFLGMGWRAIVAVVATVLGVFAPAAGAAPQARVGPDWFLVLIRSGPAGATGVSYHATQHFVLTGAGSVVAGLGTAYNTIGGQISAIEALRSTQTISSTQSAGAAHLELDTPLGSPSRGILSGKVMAIPPRTTFAALWFLANVRVTSYSRTKVSVRSGTVHVRTITGHGSQAIPIAEPAEPGAAASTPAGSAGATSYTAQTTTALAGGFVTTEYGPQAAQFWQAGWHSPNGQYSTDVQWVEAADTGTSLTGAFTFAGPAGRWSWNWTGIKAGLADTAFAAYAPIGKYWTLFAQCPGHPGRCA